MKALIFNSGLGNRMGVLTSEHHKSMARLGNGETIFARQLRLLAAAGITEVIVTTGPFAEELIATAARPEHAGLKVTTVPNPVYDQTNYLYSMHLAGGQVADDVLLLHGDLVFNRALLDRLIADPRPDLGLVNPELPLPEKDFKARVVDGIVTEVSVSIDGEDCVAFQPLYKLSRRALGVWLDRVASFVEAGNTGVYAENALNEVAEAAGIHAFSYAGDYVNEVDTPEDLASVSAAIRLFDFAEQPVLAEPDDYRKIPGLLAEVGAVRPLLVGGSAYRASHLPQFLAEAGLEVVQFADYSANPAIVEVRAGLKRYRESGCDSIIALGGGSAMDVAKCIKMLAATGKDDFSPSGAPIPSAVPLMAIPATAGTGSESTHFAVVYIDGEKHSIAHEALLPEWVVLDPRLLQSLPDYHKKASLLDALCQCIESVWAREATKQSREYALTGIRLILDHLFAYFHGAGVTEEVATTILRAANLGGKAINLTKTTAAHAMSYQLTSLYGVAHGHAAALCLRAVWRLFAKAAEGDDGDDPTGLAESLELITKAFEAKHNWEAVGKLDVILEFLRVPAPEIGDPDNLELLVSSVNAERLGNSPLPLTEDDLRRCYEFVFGLRSLPYLDPDPETDPVGRLAIQLAGEPATQRYADVDALHAYGMEILTAFDRFCTDHDLQYYLSEGSMLGAIRHGGYIPWDDDIDVMVPRSDYQKLVELNERGALPDGLNLDCFETNPLHWVLGAKLQLTRKTEFSQPKVVGRAHYSGPYIDIFPVDSVAQPVGNRFRLQALLLRTLRRALFMGSGHSRGLRKNPVLRVPLYLLTRVVSTRTMHRWVTKVQSEFNSSPDAGHWANLCSYYPIQREVFPKEWFGTGRRVSFEGESLPIPDQAERMLRGIYGPDYRKVPSLGVYATRSHTFVVNRDLGRDDDEKSPAA